MVLKRACQYHIATYLVGADNLRRDKKTLSVKEMFQKPKMKAEFLFDNNLAIMSYYCKRTSMVGINLGSGNVI